MLQHTDEREDQIVRDCVAALEREYAPMRILLFGSRAKGTARLGSDFDFAITGSAPDAARLMRMQEHLEAIAGLYSVNLVFLDDVDPGFREIVLQTGKVLYDHT